MRRWWYRHGPDCLLALLGLVLAYLSLFARVPRCHAEDLGPEPFSLVCPAPARCQRAEGIWASTPYMKKLAADSVLLDACTKNLALMQGEIDAHKTSRDLAVTRASVLGAQLVLKQRVIDQLQEAEWRRDRKLERRTRWAIAATVLGVVLAGALGAGVYAAGH